MGSCELWRGVRVHCTKLIPSWDLHVSRAALRGSHPGISLVAVASAAIGPLSALVVPGFIYGLAQWLVLQRSTTQAGWWLVANSIGWIIAAAIGVSLAMMLLPGYWRGLPFYPVASVIYFALASFMVLSIFAGITGVLLIGLLRSRPVEVDYAVRG